MRVFIPGPLNVIWDTDYTPLNGCVHYLDYESSNAKEIYAQDGVTELSNPRFTSNGMLDQPILLGEGDYKVVEYRYTGNGNKSADWNDDDLRATLFVKVREYFYEGNNVSDNLSSMIVVDTIADLKAISDESVLNVMVLGYFTKTDSYPRVFYRSDTGTSDGGSVIKSTATSYYWKLTNSDEINASAFGIIPQGIDDDFTSQMASLASYCVASNKKICYFNAGARFSGTLNFGSNCFIHSLSPLIGTATAVISCKNTNIMTTAANLSWNILEGISYSSLDPVMSYITHLKVNSAFAKYTGYSNKTFEIMEGGTITSSTIFTDCRIIDNGFEGFITGKPSFICTAVNQTVKTSWFTQNQTLTSNNLPTRIIFNSECVWTTETILISAMGVTLCSIDFRLPSSTLLYAGTTELQIDCNEPLYHSLSGIIVPKNYSFVKSEWYVNVSDVVNFPKVDFCNRSYSLTTSPVNTGFYWKNGTLNTAGSGIDFNKQGTLDRITTRGYFSSDLSYLNLISSTLIRTDDVDKTITNLNLKDSSFVATNINATFLDMDNSSTTYIRSNQCVINRSTIGTLILQGTVLETIGAHITNTDINTSLNIAGYTTVEATGSKCDIYLDETNKVAAIASTGTFNLTPNANGYSQNFLVIKANGLRLSTEIDVIRDVDSSSAEKATMYENLFLLNGEIIANIWIGEAHTLELSIFYKLLEVRLVSPDNVYPPRATQAVVSHTHLIAYGKYNNWD